jgi:hypothetical protein
MDKDIKVKDENKKQLDIFSSLFHMIPMQNVYLLQGGQWMS